MRALTVQQPWAWAIMHGQKSIENRTHNWSYRGPLAIHTGARWSSAGAFDPRVHDAWDEHSDVALPVSDPRAHMFSAVLGVVDLVDVHTDKGCCRPWGDSVYDDNGALQPIVTHLVLQRPRPLSVPIPCKGMLGLWTPTPDVLDAISAQIGGDV